MSEEKKIKQFEEEQLDKLIKELKDIDNFKFFRNGSFKYDIGKYQADLLLNYIEQLQQENKELKKLTDKLYYEHDHEFKIWVEERSTFIKFEKWLEEYKYEVDIDEYVTIQIILNKLQELKEGKK